MFLWMCNMQFRERSQEMFAKFRKFFAQSLKRTKKFSLLKALFSSKNHFCVSRMQNWQASQEYYANSPKIAAPSPKEMEKRDFNWKRLFYKTNLWDDRMQFWQTPAFFPKSLEVTKWVLELQKKVPKIVPLDSQYAVMTTQIKIMAIVRTLFARSLKNKKRIFLKTLFSSKRSSGHIERKFGHTDTFLAKSPKKFSSKFRKVGKNCFFEKIIFFLQGDNLGPIECGFEKSSELFFQKVQNWQSCS